MRNRVEQAHREYPRRRLSLQLTHQVKRGLKGLGAGLPLSRAHLVTVLGDKLGCLKQAEQLVRITADTAGVHLVHLDLALGIDDEGAALGQAVLLNEHLEVTGKRVRGVGKHRIGYLADALRGLMPGLVGKVRVRGNGVHLATGSGEFRILVRQVLKLRGAHKGEVSGIEEEQRPLAQDVVLADGAELVVLIGLDGKSAISFPISDIISLLSSQLFAVFISTESYYE